MFSGSIVALITPFKNNELDEQAFRQLIEWQIEQGTSAIVPVGTTGESPTLSNVEDRKVVEVAVQQSAGRVPVLAGAGSNNPQESIRAAISAQECGADGVLVVTGYYNRPCQEGIFRHIKSVHDSISIPIIVYNIPARVIVDIEPITMARIAKLPRVIGVKDATGDLSRISRERQLIGTHFDYLSGDDITAVSYNAAGGKGCISVTANIAPSLCAKLQDACARGDYDAALAYHDKLLPLHLALFEEPSPAGVKYAASLLGLCREDARAPILPIAASTRDNILAAMKHAGVFNESLTSTLIPDVTFRPHLKAASENAVTNGHA